MLRQLTAEQFLDERYELPACGQWAELVEGIPILLEPPDLDHGTTVLNLSKALAAYIERTKLGYACFDLGLHLSQDPDTLRFPAACYFVEGERFAEADKPYTDTRPVLVIEMASTADRRKQMTERVEAYLTWGVPSVWVIDQAERCLHVCSLTRQTAVYKDDETFAADSPLDGLHLKIADLFAEPEWWSERPKP